LLQDESSGRWYEVSDAVAREKVGQQLREWMAKKDIKPAELSVKRNCPSKRSDKEVVSAKKGRAKATMCLSRPRPIPKEKRKREAAANNKNSSHQASRGVVITTDVPPPFIIPTAPTVVSELHESSDLSMQSEESSVWDLSPPTLHSSTSEIIAAPVVFEFAVSGLF
jgi:hypothetical protein